MDLRVARIVALAAMLFVMIVGQSRASQFGSWSQCESTGASVECVAAKALGGRRDPDIGAQLSIVQANPGSLLGGRNPSALEAARGNPIVIATGNKIESELDFSTSGDSPLRIRRTYNHYWTGVGVFGKHWTSTLDYKLTFGTTAVDACYPRPGGGRCAIGAHTSIFAWRPDGRVIKFMRAPDGNFYEDKPSAIAKIVLQGDRFLLYNEQDGLEEYDASGYVLSVTDAFSVSWNYEYSGTFPTGIAHTSGRRIELTWSSGQLVAVRDPAGNYYGYAYHPNYFGSGIHRLASVSRPGTPASTVTYHYEHPSFPAALTGKSVNGSRYSSFGYDSNGFATSTEHNGVRRYTFAYTQLPGGALSVVENSPLGKTTTYLFENARLRSITRQASTYSPASYSEISYDANGYPRLASDENGVATLYTYNGKGQLLQRIEAYGHGDARTSEYEWDTVKNRIVKETIVGELRREYLYTAGGRVDRITLTNLSNNGVSGQSRSTWFGYSYHAPVYGNAYALGMLAAVTVDGPEPGTGDNSTVTFDALGNMTETWSGADGRLIYSNHDGLGLARRVTNENGAVTDYTYTARGQIASVQTYIAGAVQTKSFQYDGNGNVTSITQPDGVVRTYGYDANDKDLLISETVASSGVLHGGGTSERRSWSYALSGQPAAQSDHSFESTTTYEFVCLQPRGAPQYACNEPDYRETQVSAYVQKQSSSIWYDELGRRRAETGNSGQNSTFAYDPAGNLTAYTDSLGRTTRYAYDSLDRLIRLTRPDGGVEEFRYNKSNRLIWAKDARGLVTTYSLDGFGQLWAQVSPDTGLTQFAYNAGGQLARITRNDGSYLDYLYDERGRTVYVGNSAERRSYSYDWCTNGKSRLCGMEYADTAVVHSWIHYAYNAEGLVTIRREAMYGSDNWTGYNYDSAGRLAGISYPSGASVGYGYSHGRLTAVTAHSGGTNYQVLSGIKYQPFGEHASWSYGNGLAKLKNIDQDGRVSGMSVVAGSQVVQSLTFGFNQNDRVVAITNGVSAALSQSYGYDALDQLSRQSYGSGGEQLRYYDYGGNVSAVTSPWSESMSIDASSNRISAMGSHAYYHDLRGNRSSYSISGSTASYGYDSFNRLNSYSRNLPVSFGEPNGPGGEFVHRPSGVWSYLYNPLDQRVGKTGPDGQTRFIYGNEGELLAEYGPGGWKSYVWAHGELVGMINGAQAPLFVHGDQLGRPETVTDGGMSVVWRASNFAFGRTVSYDAIGTLNIGFPGQYYDKESGLWQNGYRDYDSRLGRYIQPDPIGLAGGFNSYSYVQNDPVNWIDFFGLQRAPDSTDHLWRPPSHNCRAMMDCVNEMNRQGLPSACGKFPMLRGPLGWLGCGLLRDGICEHRTRAQCSGGRPEPYQDLTPVSPPLPPPPSPPEPEGRVDVGPLQVVREERGGGGQGGGGSSGGGRVLIGTVIVGEVTKDDD